MSKSGGPKAYNIRQTASRFANPSGRDGQRLHCRDAETQQRRHSVAAPPLSMTLIYEQPTELSTRHLHFFDSAMTVLMAEAVDNPASQPAKLLIEGRNPYNLAARRAGKRISAARAASARA
jgi:hypothetical protein